jgi:hypothetical protein
VQDAPETKHSNWAATGPRGTYPSRVGQSLPAGQSRKPNMGPSLPQLAGLAAAALVVGSHEMALALGGSIVVPQVLIGQLPQGGHVPPDGLGDETGFVSPPRIERPYFVCSDVIVVTGVLPGAKLEIEVMIAGRLDTVIFQAGDDGAYQVDLPGKLQTTADWIRARQLWGGETSAWDAGPTPSNHALEVSATYPNGLPVPTAYYEPFYDCGIRTGMSNFVPGSRVKMTILRVNGSTSVLFDYPKWAAWAAEGGGNQFFIDDHLEASYEFCGESMRSSPLHEYKVVPRPAVVGQFPVPWIDAVFEMERVVQVQGLLHGATAHVFDSNGLVVGGQPTVSTSAAVRAVRALVPGEALRATQSFGICGESDKGPETIVRPCSELRAAEIERPAPGDEEVRVLSSRPGAVILVWDASGVLIGRGAAPVVGLSRPLTTTEEIRVTQRVGTCDSSTSYQINVDCGPKGRGELDLLQQLSDRRRRRGSTTLVAAECK